MSSGFAPLRPFNNLISPLQQGIVPDGVALTDASIAAGSNALYSASYTFTPADIGKLVTVAGAGASGKVLNATINGVSLGNANLSINAGTTVTGAAATFGTDKSALLNAYLLSTAARFNQSAVVLPGGIWIIANPLIWQSGVSLLGNGWGKSLLKWLSLADMAGGVIQGITRGASNPYTDVQFRDFEIDASAATQAAFNTAGKGLYLTFLRRFVVDRVRVHDSPATAIGCDYYEDGWITNNQVENGGRLYPGTGGGGAGIGIGIGGMPVEAYTISGNHAVNCATYGIFLETESAGTTFDVNATITENNVRMGASSIAAIGDCGAKRTLIAANIIHPGGGDAIVVQAGTLGLPPGQQGLISDNIITGVGGNGIVINYTVNIPSSACQYDLNGNRIHAVGQHGMKITANATATFDTLSARGNDILGCGFSGMYFGGAGGFKDINIKANDIYNNGLYGGGNALNASGIAINANIARLRLDGGNNIYDNASGNQKWAVTVNTGMTVSNAYMNGNDLRNNASGSINALGTLTGWISDNAGYNPLGPVNVTPGASPWTYTAGNTPERLHINGGTVSAVSKNSIVLAAASPTAIDLQPGEQVVVTYSAAPTAVADRR